MNRKKRRAQAKTISKLSTSPLGRPVRISSLFDEALQHHQAGRLGDAERLYRQVLAVDACHADTLHLLGLIAHREGRHEAAMELIGQAVAVKSDAAVYHANLGIVLWHLGRYPEAAAAYRAALLQDRNDASSLSNLAAVLTEIGEVEEAHAAAQAAINVSPHFPEAFNNLGNALKQMGRAADSIKVCRTAIRLRADFVGAYNSLGGALFDLGRHEEAVKIYDAALCIDPAVADTYANRCAALLALNAVLPAFASVCRSLRLAERPKAKPVFTECMKRLSFQHCPPDVHAWMVRALGEPWGRPKDLAQAALRLIWMNPGIAGLSKTPELGSSWSEHDLGHALDCLGNDALLLQLLRVSAIPDIRLERVLTACRAAILGVVLSDTEGFLDSGARLSFLCSLAQQCFINEYVFSISTEEMNAVEALRVALGEALESGAEIPAERLILLACYVPLHSLPAADRLLDKMWVRPIEDVLTMQIREPLTERRIARNIRRLNEVKDQTSAEVRQQYEENPYPRWVSSAPITPCPSLDQFVQASFPRQTYRPQGKAQPDILIAGCGTGLHPIETARRFPRARLLAVDLSLASLAYAQRKAEEAGVANVEFAQADLLRLGELGRQFDVIESVGVLHHLRDPRAGMHVLASLLRPNGVFRLGLYSELARRSVVAVREHIGQRGIGSGAADIRRCRHELLALEEGDVRKEVVRFVDFFSTSDCRDLLFHVQEHRLSIPDIAGWLEECGLVFLGFDIEPEVRKSFCRQFSHEEAERDLGLWRHFEEANPNTFASMYQFWAQKAE